MMATRVRRGLGLAGVILLTLSACGDAGDADDGDEGSDITLVWEANAANTERLKAAFQDPFFEETGITIENVSSPTAVNQIQTMVETGNVVWDMTHKGSYTARQFCGTLFEELDFASVSTEHYPEGSTTPCSRPATKYGLAFAYDTEAYPDDPPTQIEDFFDTERFPGKRVILGTNARGVIEASLVADGVHPDDLFPMDIERGIAKLDTIKDDIIFAPTLTALEQNLIDKQATMTITFTISLPNVNDAGGTLAPVWDYTSWDFDAFLVVKGSKNVEAAEQFIEFALDPERVSHFAGLAGSTPVREDVDLSTIPYGESQALFNPFLGEVLGEDRGVVQLSDPDWWSENNSALNEAYVAWQVG